MMGGKKGVKIVVSRYTHCVSSVKNEKGELRDAAKTGSGREQAQGKDTVDSYRIITPTKGRTHRRIEI
jgi:hypothetical protein